MHIKIIALVLLSELFNFSEGMRRPHRRRESHWNEIEVRTPDGTKTYSLNKLGEIVFPQMPIKKRRNLKVLLEEIETVEQPSTEENTSSDEKEDTVEQTSQSKRPSFQSSPQSTEDKDSKDIEDYESFLREVGEKLYMDDLTFFDYF